MKKKTRQVKIKACVMWQLSPRKDQPDTIRPFGWGGTIPVFVLPATPEAYDAMVEQGAKAIVCNRPGYLWGRWSRSIAADTAREHMRNVLTALSLVRPTK